MTIRYRWTPIREFAKRWGYTPRFAVMLLRERMTDIHLPACAAGSERAGSTDE